LASRRLSPSLTTVSQHGPEIGEAAAKLLIERLENTNFEEDRDYKTTVIKTELRDRDSTKKAK
jgi:LacI family transcriptional regulator